jgi:anti-sigma B factor antagonist
MLRLKCLNCGLLVPYKGSAGGLCPRCLVREDRAVELITVSDQPASVAGRSVGRLTIRTRQQNGSHVIVLTGELDIASSQMLDEALAEACASGAESIVVDLGGVEFMDSTGLSSLLRGRQLCEGHGCEYSLTPAQRPVERVFETTGLRKALRFRGARRGNGATTPLESS